MEETIETVLEDERWPTIAVVAVTAAATVVAVKAVQRVKSRRWMNKHYPKAKKV